MSTNILEKATKKPGKRIRVSETGTVLSITGCVVLAAGLPYVALDELVSIKGAVGMVMSLEKSHVSIVMLSDAEGISAGDKVVRLHRIADVPVGPSLLGRAIDPTGRAIDGGRAITAKIKYNIERPAHPIFDRQSVGVPLQTGIKAIDSIIPIGRGQRELILGDRQTGKTALAVDSMIAQKGTGVICIYCAIGGRTDSAAKVRARLIEEGAMENSIILAASAESSPGLLYIAPYAAASIAEYFMEVEKRDVLIIYDSLSAHAAAYRQMSLYLKRPPGREAYPGDIFYIHSRLLERATRLRDGGSITALPICETLAENMSAYIPTNLISITDGQIFLSASLFGRGILPALNIGISVSRVGSRAQLPAYAQVSGDMKISYAQFEELEAFSRFGASLDEATAKAIARGERVREVLKQPQGKPMRPAEQIIIMAALNAGVFDPVPLDKVAAKEDAIIKSTRRDLKTLMTRIEKGGKLSASDLKHIAKVANDAKPSGH
ncbi:MAG: F0F1 ATP synthase subunit alpha [Rickettsiales bacterium]|jgi:F-type H+-transporting ATPase subunit alpha|nr:F0F1 ATP synthase subunit alpha [Rickettsiales bacterium]